MNNNNFIFTFNHCVIVVIKHIKYHFNHIKDHFFSFILSLCNNDKIILIKFNYNFIYMYECNSYVHFNYFDDI